MVVDVISSGGKEDNDSGMEINCPNVDDEIAKTIDFWLSRILDKFRNLMNLMVPYVLMQLN